MLGSRFLKINYQRKVNSGKSEKEISDKKHEMKLEKSRNLYFLILLVIFWLFFADYLASFIDI